MGYTFTREEMLLNKIYGMLDPTENEAVDAALIINSKLRDEYEQMLAVKETLDLQKPMQPSQSSIDLIMAYSELTKPIKINC